MAKKTAAVEAMPMKQESELTIRLPPESPFKKDLKSVGLEQAVTITGKGQVSAFNADKWGCGLTVKLTSLKVDAGMGGDLKRFRKERTYKA